MLRRSDLKYTKFKDIQGLPKDLEPIYSAKWFSSEDAYYDIIQGLKILIKKIINRKEIESKRVNSIEPKKPKHTTKNSCAILRTEQMIAMLKIILEEFNSFDKLSFLDFELLKRDRKNIAMELHDNVGSQLALLKIITSQLKFEDELTKRLTWNIDEIINSIRQISHTIV